MRARLLTLLLVTFLAPGLAAADPRYSVGFDFPILPGADPKLMFGIGYFVELTFPRDAIHAIRVGGEDFAMGSRRSNANSWLVSYRRYHKPGPDSRFLPFVGVAVGSYTGGYLRDENDQDIPDTDFAGKLGVSAELGTEVMFSKGLRGFGVRLSVVGVYHPEAQWVTFPIAMLIWLQ